LQHAQPITLAAYFRAYAEMLSRDRGRLADCLKRTDLSPLGSGALFGVNHPIDRGWVARELGFRSVTANPLDAVSDRDFAIELLSCISLIMMHLSRFAEEYIVFASQEFSYLEPADGYSTGSSIMPQKKNPDMAELIRGKSGRAFGNLITLLTIMKGLPLAYNKDMQEDKEPYFDSIDTVKSCLDIFSGMLAATKFNKAEMRKKTKLGFMNATDAADYLASRGVPFREAHRIVGELVLYAIKKGKAFEDLSLEEYKKFSGVFDEKIFDAISYEKSVARKTL
jgi:argininosuccinate lyase